MFILIKGHQEAKVKVQGLLSSVLFLGSLVSAPFKPGRN